MSDELNHSFLTARIGNLERVKEKLQTLIDDGPERLQVSITINIMAAVLLVACKRLILKAALLVGRSVSQLVGWSVDWSVGQLIDWFVHWSVGQWVGPSVADCEEHANHDNRPSCNGNIYVSKKIRSLRTSA